MTTAEHTSTVQLIDLPSKATLIDSVRAASVRQRQAEIEQLALVAAMTEVWSVTDSSCWDAQDEQPPQVLFGERLVTPGADGTPQVAEFLALELGCALEASPDSARALIADVLNLRHRLPIVWEQALSGGVRVWLARRVAQETASLPLAAARAVDASLGPRLTGMGPKTVLSEVSRLVVLHDEELNERQAQKLLHRSVTFSPDPLSGVTAIEGTLDPLDARHLDATLNRGADVLTQGGCEGSRAELRAVTLGVLAHPAKAYHLLDEGLPFEADGPADDTPRGIGDGSARCSLPEDFAESSSTTSVPVCRHGADLIVRVGRDEVRAEAGGTLEGFGPITNSYLQRLLADCDRVTVRPVIDLSEPVTVSSYRPSSRIAWIVKERDRREVFPYSNRAAHGRGIDCDHTHEWNGRNTTTHNLGPLSRRVHRAKTHGGYQVEQISPGTFHWRTPAGQQFWTTAQGTWRTPPPAVRANSPATTTSAMLTSVLKAAARQGNLEALQRAVERANWEAKSQHALPTMGDDPPPF